MAVSPFLRQFGFTADPFASTNADDEPKLETYFVPPPYFDTVLGDVHTPKSHVILAPRGGGKTAQRLMIEKRSQVDKDFLCITYDEFDLPHSFKLKDATWSYHMNQVCRLVLMGILLQIEEKPQLAKLLTNNQKQIIKYQVERFLGSLSSDEFELAIKSVKNFGDKAKDIWNKYGGLVASLINAFITKYGLDKVDLPTDIPDETKKGDSLRFHFRRLLEISATIEFCSVYVLVDKIDEISLTAKDAKSTFRFMQELITDLPTLETPGVGFKFFIWDQTADAYASSGSRPDRVPIFILNWTAEELQKMLSERLRAHSDGVISSFNELLPSSFSVDIHLLLAHFAAGSPRDMIRLAQRIVSEETRISTNSSALSFGSIWKGIRTFSNERAEELYGNHLGHLRKPGTVTFTVNQLANDVFHVTTQAARARVQKWMDAAAVAKIGELPNPGNRPLHLYGVADLRLAVAMLPAHDLDLILGNFAIVCPSCGTVCISDQSEMTCMACESGFNLSEAQSLIELCTV